MSTLDDSGPPGTDGRKEIMGRSCQKAKSAERRAWETFKK